MVQVTDLSTSFNATIFLKKVTGEFFGVKVKDSIPLPEEVVNRSLHVVAQYDVDNPDYPIALNGERWMGLPDFVQAAHLMHEAGHASVKNGHLHDSKVELEAQCWAIRKAKESDAEWLQKTLYEMLRHWKAFGGEYEKAYKLAKDRKII